MAGFCEHDNEPLASIKDGECIDKLSDYQLLKKDSVPWSSIQSFRLLTTVNAN
jgi:hypothetical protein